MKTITIIMKTIKITIKTVRIVKMNKMVVIIPCNFSLNASNCYSNKYGGNFIGLFRDTGKYIDSSCQRYQRRIINKKEIEKDIE